MIVRTYGRRSRFSTSTSSTSDSDSHPCSQPESQSQSQSQPFSLSQEFDFDFDPDLDENQISRQFSEPLEFSQPQPPPPLLNFSAFSSQDSSFSLDHLDDSPPNNKNRRNSKRRDEEKAKAAVARRDVTSTLMEAQEFGEMMESVDEVNFALDGLRHGQPRRVRRASLLSLLSICGTAARRRILRAQGSVNALPWLLVFLLLDLYTCIKFRGKFENSSQIELIGKEN